MQMPLLPSNPSVRDSSEYIRKLTRWVGAGFHPHTPFSEYVRPDGSRSFDSATCAKLQGDLAIAAATLDGAGIDVCAVALPVQRAILLGR